ncbi:GDP-mannose 4,6-dehydratase, partial [Candidatus Peregrinibacteria bacterium]|nr:GDP-mannose 4,6-dehydratase [Candidatus Peregrinibacteria bacterium]
AGALAYREEMADFRNCESPYTASKIAGEALIQAYTRCYALDHVIFRFSNVYGMYDDSERVIPLFIRRAQKNEPLVVYGKDKCLDFTYIDDTVDGILRTIDRFADVKNDTYNIANGKGTTIVELAETVRKLTGSASKVHYRESRTGEVIRFTADITKAKEKLGYAPQTSFEEGIRKTVEWYSKISPLPAGPARRQAGSG